MYAGCSRQPLVFPKSSSPSSICTVCSLTPPSSSVTSSCGEVFCFSCLLHALIEKHQADKHQEPAIQSRHEGDLDVVYGADDMKVLVQKELSAQARREQIKQLQQLEDNIEQLKTTLVCALGLESLEDRAWVDEAIAKEKLETRREIARLERRTTVGRL